MCHNKFLKNQRQHNDQIPENNIDKNFNKYNTTKKKLVEGKR